MLRTSALASPLLNQMNQWLIAFLCTMITCDSEISRELQLLFFRLYHLVNFLCYFHYI